MHLQIHETLSILENWRDKGFRKLSNGTEIICHVPKIGPEAWLHLVYAPLPEETIDSLEQHVVAKKMPQVLKEFYRKMNGINLFSDVFCVNGLRTSYVRTGNESIQPYDLVTLDSGRHKECPNSWLIFGSYSWDGSHVVMDTSESDNPKVFRIERWTTNILLEWDYFSEWLNSETVRVQTLFDENGYQIDPSIPTV
ncbi:SMI1/KNR4 family protein [Neobacillus massiliamazoniensis]|uniref:Knr4/Smi1-like domain-containing protein n=1 Tax=Neobacillus massiliamazoniensis TaxID=1499688 RepID=A0A0U1P350_9BACI|nr:SMI1/KNR4 family protein [Neobacillus massiliamazoniensis]CRK84725.1 hypothetical protein BN000_04772 [Neobacillus massiliamazoniensis]